MDKLEKIIGFVALIDVLGFRELVGRDDDLSQIHQYIEAVASLLETRGGPSQLQYVLFSDNVVVNTRTTDEEAFVRLVAACSNLAFQLAQQGIADTYGSFVP